MSRKIFAVCTLLCYLMLTGCRGIEKTPDYSTKVTEALAQNFSFQGELTWEDMTVIANVVKTDPTDLQVNFTAPENVAGLSVILQKDTAKVLYRGMELDMKAYDIPAQSVLPVLWELLSGKNQTGLTVQAEDEQVIARGSLYLTSFTMIFDKKTMILQEISIPDLGVVVIVKDFKFLENK